MSAADTRPLLSNAQPLTASRRALEAQLSTGTLSSGSGKVFLPFSIAAIERRRHIPVDEKEAFVVHVGEGAIKVIGARDDRRTSLGALYGAGRWLILLPNQLAIGVAEQSHVRTWMPGDFNAASPRRFITLMTVMLEELAWRVAVLKRFSIQVRLLCALKEFGELAGAAAGGQIHLPPVTHEELASFIGTSREIITTALAEVRHSAIVTRLGRALYAVDRKALEAALDRHDAILR